MASDTEQGWLLRGEGMKLQRHKFKHLGYHFNQTTGTVVPYEGEFEYILPIEAEILEERVGDLEKALASVQSRVHELLDDRKDCPCFVQAHPCFTCNQIMFADAIIKKVLEKS
jgi:hypothetical protein